MALFSFFRTPKHQQFRYMPRYYNPTKEKLDQIIENAKNRTSNDPELVKMRISSSFRQRSSGSSELRHRAARRSNILLIVIVILLVAATYMLLNVYLPSLISQLEG